MSLSGIKVEKRFHDRLWIIEGNIIDRATIDAWEAAVRAYTVQFKDTHERYLVYDLTKVDKLKYLPYLHERIAALSMANRSAVGRIAAAARFDPTFRYLIDTYWRYTGQILQPSLEINLFLDLEAAVGWVAEAMPDAYKV